MNQPYCQDKIFSNLDYAGKESVNKEFDACTFSACDFSSADFSKSEFVDCVFESCNLSLVKLNGTGIKNITFKNCKLVGVEFHECSDFLFEVFFEQCVLDFSAFLEKKMPGSVFNKCKLEQTDFTNAILA